MRGTDRSPSAHDLPACRTRQARTGINISNTWNRDLRAIKKTDLAERRGTATEAKAALLQAYRAAQKASPEREARQQERIWVAEAREARQTARQQAKLEEQARMDAEAREREAALAKAATAEADARERAENQRITRVLDDEAMRKAMRDQRYAARKTRRG